MYDSPRKKWRNILISQDQLPMVAVPSMNDTHLEEMILVNKLSNAAKENNITEVSDTLNTLLEHTKAHFSGEEKMMEETSFPAFAMHKGEHDRHLHELKSLIEYFAKNQDPRAVTAYIDGNLEKWLIHHIQTMDTVTAKHLAERM